ncbi:MAG: mgtE-like transporter, partial [Glaciecola sp.]
GGLLASVVLIVVVVALARAVSARDWNMDDVGAPTITATGDLLAIPALLLASRLVDDPSAAASTIIGWVSVVAAIAALARGVLHSDDTVRSIVRQSFVVLSVSATLSVISGVVIETRGDIFRGTPALLVLFPPFIAMFGSLGGILASRLTSKLHLGVIEARAVPERLAAYDILMAYVMATGIFLFVGIATWGFAVVSGLQHPSFARLIGVSMAGGFMGTTLLSIVAYTAATTTYRFGLDPDNHAIPVVTSTMDLLGMLCLVAALGLFNVAG